MSRLCGTCVLHGCDARRMRHRCSLLRLHRRLRDDGGALLDRNDRSTDLTLRCAFLGCIRDNAKEQHREEHVNEKRREITSRKPLTIAPVPRIALCHCNALNALNRAQEPASSDAHGESEHGKCPSKTHEDRCNHRSRIS